MANGRLRVRPLVACFPGGHRGNRPVQRVCSPVLIGYLVRYQNSGVSSYWLRFSNAVGVVADMFDFHTHT
jgi:hypothetical protein